MTARTPTRLPWRRLLLSATFAFVAAVLSVTHVSLPASVSARHLDVAAAATRISVEMPRPLATDAQATSGRFQALNRRTTLLANIVSSPPVIARIARRAGVGASQIASATRITTGVQAAFTEPDSERRAAQIAAADARYQLELQPSPTLPRFDVYVQAPSVADAVRIADAVVPATADHLAAAARAQSLAPGRRLRLEQMGPARGAIVNGGARLQIAALTFLFVFGGGVLGCAVVARAGSAVAAGGSAAPVSSAQPGDWPRTTRVLPWAIAMMMALVFLVPFNEIELDVPLPIDLSLDRLVLPLVVAAWAVAMAAGRPGGPRLRLTWIHAALGVVVAVALLSIVLNARTLNQTLELDTAVKKLTLLGAYVSLFVVVASGVRRGEVRAYMTYTLVLATLCAIGTIVEFRTQYNVFYAMSDSLLPGIFRVGVVDTRGVDQIGRRAVRGPGQVPLELVAMLAMALSIAIVRLVHSPTARRRLVYALVVGLLIAAMVSTFRKTAFLAPLSVCLTFVYFRRREALRLAPLGAVLVLVVQVLSPGALSAVAGQLDRNRLGVTTVSDRTADYDAIRPDVWSNLVFGRGYGSYEHTSYRILDMELLRQLIEVGVVGLLAYLGLAVVVVAVARAPIRRRSGEEAAVALAVAPAAVCFAVVSTLFDVMSFPHVPYIFLWLAALLAVVGQPVRPVARAPGAARAPGVREIESDGGRALPVAREPAWSS